MLIRRRMLHDNNVKLLRVLEGPAEPGTVLLLRRTTYENEKLVSYFLQESHQRSNLCPKQLSAEKTMAILFDAAPIIKCERLRTSQPLLPRCLVFSFHPKVFQALPYTSSRSSFST